MDQQVADGAGDWGIEAGSGGIYKRCVLEERLQNC